MIRLTKENGRTKTKAYRDTRIGDFSSGADEYISLNSFSSPNRRSEHIREIKCIYFDLDLHNGPANEINAAIENTLHLLDGAWDYQQLLPKPTAITISGRGLGLYYILKDSIPCNLPNSKKSIQYYKTTYNLLHNRLIEVLRTNGLYDEDGNKVNLLEIDTTSICDTARVVRVPGTFNTAAQKHCELVCLDPHKKYSLKDINDTYFVDEWEELKNRVPIKKWEKRTKPMTNTINEQSGPNPFRLKAMEQLQALHNYNCVGRREYMCFIYYNSARPLYGEDIAFARLVQFNGQFLHPIPFAQLSAIKHTTAKAKDWTGTVQGFYRLTNQWIIDHLALTDEEQKTLLLFGKKYTAQGVVRANKKHQSQLEKQARNAAITEMVIQSPSMTYREIGSHFGLSERTIKRVCQRSGVSRASGKRQQPYNEKGEEYEK